MKKYIFMAAALIMMGMGSCSNDDAVTEVEQAPKKVKLSLIAKFDMGGETRAEWDTDGVTPKFKNGDKVGVYSDAAPDVTELTVSFDSEGNATIEGMVVESKTYHLVFPYKSGSTYNSETISGFSDFEAGSSNEYPESALHYAMTTGSETSVTFKPLCALLKGVGNVSGGNMIYIKIAKLKNPVITVDGTGGATVDATTVNPSDTDDRYCVTSTDNTVKYYPVAPCDIKLDKKSGTTSITAKVIAGMIYLVAP